MPSPSVSRGNRVIAFGIYLDEFGMNFHSSHGQSTIIKM